VVQILPIIIINLEACYIIYYNWHLDNNIPDPCHSWFHCCWLLVPPLSKVLIPGQRPQEIRNLQSGIPFIRWNIRGDVHKLHAIYLDPI
jgi:hypothetical protein